MTTPKFALTQDVPIHKCLNIENTSGLERHAMKLLLLGFSFKAVNQSGKIIGVFVNGNMSKNVSKSPNIYPE